MSADQGVPRPVVIACGFTAFCGVLAGIIIGISPNPMPAGSAQLLNALIGLFTAGGFTILTLVGGTKTRENPRRRSSPRRDVAHSVPDTLAQIPHAPSMADPPATSLQDQAQVR